jgi:hypothetical protein
VFLAADAALRGGRFSRIARAADPPTEAVKTLIHVLADRLLFVADDKRLSGDHEGTDSGSHGAGAAFAPGSMALFGCRSRNAYYQRREQTPAMRVSSSKEPSKVRVGAW